MQRKNVILAVKSLSEPIARGNFKKLCEELNFPYHSLKMLKFPITHEEYIIYKVEFK